MIPNACEEALLDLILAPNMTLRLFTNDVESGLTPTQIEAITAASFTEATFAGYSSKALTGGSWTTTQGDPSTGTYAQQTFTRTSTGAVQTVRGYYIVRTTGGALCWYEYFDGAIATENNGDTVTVTPTFTLTDDEEATVAARGLLASQTITSDSSAYTSSGATDFALSNFDADGTRNYRLHVTSMMTMSGDGIWLMSFAVDGVNTERCGAFHVATGGVSYEFLDGIGIWQPSTGQYDLTVTLSEAAGTSSLTLNGLSDAPRRFWIEDIGPR
jgi:hypothetical protein